jgi:anti-anti-sigma factor
MENVIAIKESSHFREIMSQVIDTIDAGKKDILLDLEELDYIPSAVMGAIIAIIKKTREVGGNVVLRNVTKEISEQLKVFGVDQELGGFYAPKTK